MRLSLGLSEYDIYKAHLSSRQWRDWWGADVTKEAVAMWKQCLVHLDLFIICFQSEAAALHAVRRTLRADRCPDFLLFLGGEIARWCFNIPEKRPGWQVLERYQASKL